MSKGSHGRTDHGAGSKHSFRKTLKQIRKVLGPDWEKTWKVNRWRDNVGHSQAWSRKRSAATGELMVYVPDRIIYLSKLDEQRSTFRGQ